ncbi:MAG: exo-alpha-sialidase [Balneolales bacterium]
MTPDKIAELMNGRQISRPGGKESILPSPAIQNHAAFLTLLSDGSLACAWFGGTLEGKSDISIHAAILKSDAGTWGPAHQLTSDSDHSEQNPVIFQTPNNDLLLFNTAQPAGNQDESRVFMRSLELNNGTLVSGTPRDIDLPNGTFIRAPIQIRNDGAWLLPLFRCNPRDGVRWNGSYDTAAVAVSHDKGENWSVEDVPDSPGSVHMTPIELGDNKMAAFYRRRQADFVHRSESRDGGHTWSSPVPTEVPNNNSSIGVTRLHDGRIAMVCNPMSASMSPDRRDSLYDELGENDARPDASNGCRPIWGVPRGPLSLFISEDQGNSFPHQMVIENSSGTCLSNNSIDGKNKELSYPVILQRPDGNIDFAYTLYRRAIKHVHLKLNWINEAFS